MLETIARVSKAITAAAAAGSAAAGTALVGDQTITATEWVVVVIALGGAFIATYAAPRNREPGA